jgi:hypothetical protein
MTTTSGEVAHFHFDPGYDVDGVPDLDAVVAWLRLRMRAEGDDGLQRSMRMARDLRRPRSLMGRLASLLPGVRERRTRRTEDQCVAWAMPQMRVVHETMREFGVDLTRHRLSDVVETMASVAVLDQAIEAAASGMDPTRRPPPDPTTTEERLAPRWASIRKELEAEALVSLFDSRTLRAEWPRLVAALRASRDEITTDEVRNQVDQVADRIERALAR